MCSFSFIARYLLVLLVAQLLAQFLVKNFSHNVYQGEVVCCRCAYHLILARLVLVWSRALLTFMVKAEYYCV